MSTIDHIQACALKALGIKNPLVRPFVQQPFDVTVAFVSGACVSDSAEFFVSGNHNGTFRVATSSYWDFTNYFSQFSDLTPFYFYISDCLPLNARYFDEALKSNVLDADSKLKHHSLNDVIYSDVLTPPSGL
jgi:hypothetical protein